MTNTPNDGRNTSLIVDGSAARTGGGVSRIGEIASALSELAPQQSSQIYIPAGLPRPEGNLTGVRFNELGPRLRAAPARMLWQHYVLPAHVRKERPGWFLSPFNVIPLGRKFAGPTRTAVIVSNIQPFAPESIGRINKKQAIRIAILKKLTLASIERADIVFLLSHEAERRLATHLQKERVRFLPMSPPTPKVIEQAERLPPPRPFGDRPYFVGVGDLMPHKGFEDAVIAVAELNRRGHDVGLVLCGAAIDPAYRARLDELADDGSIPVSFSGATGQAQTLATMRGAAGTIFSSRVENTSRVPVEAASVSCPVIAVSKQHAREQCGEVAVYYPEDDPNALADQCELLLTDPSRRATLTQRAADHFLGIDHLDATRTILDEFGLL